MNDLLAVLNHILAAWAGGLIERDISWGGLTLNDLMLEEDGFRAWGRIERGGATGEIVLRGRIEPGSGGRQRIHLRLERWPEKLPPAMESFRSILESMRITVEVDFDPTVREV